MAIQSVNNKPKYFSSAQVGEVQTNNFVNISFILLSIHYCILFCIFCSINEFFTTV